MIRILVLALLCACGHPRQPMTPTSNDHHWNIYDGETLVLEVSSRPGPILSTATLPPGASPQTSAFMSATSRDAGHENQLHEILVASHGLDEFLGKLRAAGLDVRAVD